MQKTVIVIVSPEHSARPLNVDSGSVLSKYVALNESSLFYHVRGYTISAVLLTHGITEEQLKATNLDLYTALNTAMRILGKNYVEIPYVG